eukprot:GFUD01018861.1.p1 GENE.GFUD01018861.1~~GFUD01018861.1.p1  ORF type:complete len:378 (-),score=110.75 GFUD01018861.1:36-1169(-)
MEDQEVAGDGGPTGTPSATPSQPDQPDQPDRGAAMNIKKLGLFTLAGAVIVTCQVLCEVGKQVSNYSIQYYNGGKYPLPQTILVILVEIIKLVTTLARSGCQFPPMDMISIRHSFKFLLPSLLYAVNNNIYFAGLILVPPPIWIILCSFRTVVTATIYKFVLKRDISVFQYIGALCIVASIIVAKLGDLMFAGGNTIPLLAIVLAMVASCNSVGAAVYTESLFKTSGENFLEQQFWLYFYGVFVATGVHLVSAANINLGTAWVDLGQVDFRVKMLLAVALFFSSVGGLVVAAILKKLDNIVKEYSSATANIFTAVVCSVLFPEKFTFTVFILIAMALLFLGIYLYETKKVKHVTVDNIEGERTKDGDNLGDGHGGGA